MAIIEVDSVTKDYRLGQLTSLKQSLVNAMARLTGKEVQERKPFTALDNVSFTVDEGEVLGIIGQNGAGKSTILKLLAGITAPTKGRLQVNGSVAPLIEVGAGLHPELTGRENIFLNASIMGIARSEIRKRFDEIVAFAELEEFIDTPIKRYSSGMSVRLGFSIATSVDADILIIDEVLAVGDLAFQRKCYDRMEDLIKKQGKTVLIVGHNIRQMERICSRVLLLDRGKVVVDGEPTKVCNTYYHRVTDKTEKKQYQTVQDKILGQVNTGEIEVLDISIFNGDTNIAMDTLEMHTSIRIGVRFKALCDLPSPEIIIGIHTPDFIYVSMTTSTVVENYPDFKCGVHYFECHLADMILKPGSYALRLAFFDQFNRLVWYGENLKNFRVYVNNSELDKKTQTLGLIGLVEMPFSWHFFEQREMQKYIADQERRT